MREIADDSTSLSGVGRRSSIISLTHVNVSLNGHRVLHDINWELKYGENWAVLGANGAGKSTLLRLLRGEIWPAPVNGGTRTYCLDGATPTHSPIGVKEQIKIVSAEQQQRYARKHDWHLTCETVVFTGLADSELPLTRPTKTQRAKVAATMQLLGIEDLAQADFKKLSQGQLRKVLIARALISQPRVLILDEVGVGLDKHARSQLYELVERVAQSGIQILCTTHRRDELIPSITHVMELKGGRIERIERISDRRPKTDDRAATTGGGQWSVVGRQPSLTPFHLRLTHTNVALDEGAKIVLHDVNWQMNAGEHWFVQGDNGVGKSTLLKLILGELWPAQGGKICRFGRCDFTNVWEIKQQIGYVSADFQTRYYVDISAEKVIASGFFASVGWLQPTTRAQDRRVKEVIAQLGLQSLAQRSILEMSYGQARKVLVARALVNQPKLLILDEVFDGLDAQFRAELGAMFANLAQTEQCGILLVSHHEADCLPFITHRMQIEQGRIVVQEVRTKDA